MDNHPDAEAMQDPDVKEKVNSIFCFTVAPQMRGKHIATALLERIIADAKEEGYEYLEAYPNREKSD